MKKVYLEAGKIVNTHGIKGEIKIMPYTNTPELLCGVNRLFIGSNDKKELNIQRIRLGNKNMVVAKIDGINTLETAEKYRNKLLYMHRDDIKLDNDTYFIQDLIGIEVKDADSEIVYGKLSYVLKTGANDVYVIIGDRDYLIPVISETIISTDIDHNLMLIRPLDGLFD